MKLKLSQKNDIGVLEVHEDVDAQGANILRVGITKLLQTGKNKIIVNLIEATRIPQDVLREIIKLNLVATELKGSIVIVGQAEGVKQAIKSFADPQPISFFATIDEGVRFFGQPKPITPPPKVEAGTPDPKEIFAALEQENKTLKAKLEKSNLEELRKLRTVNSQMQRELVQLEQQIAALSKDKKKAAESDPGRPKLAEIEKTLTTVLTQEGL